MHFLLILNINNFSRKTFLFRSAGPKISRILWFGPKFTNQQMNKLKRALLNAMAGEAVKFVHLLWKGGTFRNFNDSRSFTISSGTYHCNSENVVYLLQCDCCNKKYVGTALKPNFANDSMYTSHTFVLMHANTMRAVLAGVKRYHRRVSLGISLAKVIRVFFRLA